MFPERPTRGWLLLLAACAFPGMLACSQRCEGDTVATDDGCAQPCNGDGDCVQGNRCVDGLCRVVTGGGSSSGVVATSSSAAPASSASAGSSTSARPSSSSLAGSGSTGSSGSSGASSRAGSSTSRGSSSVGSGTSSVVGSSSSRASSTSAGASSSSMGTVSSSSAGGSSGLPLVWCTPHECLSPSPPPQCDAQACGGSARDGALTVDADLFPNVCQGVESTSASGVTLLGAADPAFAPGRLVLLWEVQDSFAMVGDQAEVLDPGSAGMWQVTRIVAVTGSNITVSGMLEGRYATTAARVAQACVVPEYGALSVTGALRAQPWDGTRGGVVAFYARTLDLNGTVDASGAGFRGGVVNTVSDIALQNVTALENDPVGPSAAGKGESLELTAYVRGGRGNLALGGGGGNAKNSGGGGGGNGGAGGAGGRESSGTTDPADDVNTPGMGGAAWSTTVSPLDRVSLGGGGGAGHQDSNAPGPGGAGGGLVLVMAGTMAGAGTVRANGAPGGTSPVVGNTSDGGGGGGAGGTVLLWCGSTGPDGVHVEANGGAGGDVEIPGGSFTKRGPGGGGGGGRTLVRADTSSVTTAGGAGGVNQSMPADAWGTTAGGDGQAF